MGKETKVSTDEELIRVTLNIPDLRKTLVMGSGCCAMPVAFLIEVELKGIWAVEDVLVDEEKGLVEVTLSDNAGEIKELLKEEIEVLGLKVEEVVYD